MLTRRQLLVGAGVVGTLGAAPLLSTPLPGWTGREGPVRVGLLQSAPPFIDAADLRGSRERAFAALRVQLERSAGEHPALDWLVGGPWALAAGHALPAAAMSALALDPGSHEVRLLRGFARRRALRVTLGAWWRDRHGGVTARLVSIDRHGSLAIQPLAPGMPVNPGESFMGACARLGLPGACIEPACDPATPPYVAAPAGGGTRLLGADGCTIVAAATQAETWVVGELTA